LLPLTGGAGRAPGCLAGPGRGVGAVRGARRSRWPPGRPSPDAPAQAEVVGGRRRGVSRRLTLCDRAGPNSQIRV